MEAFLGTWKMEKSEGFDKIMERLGVDFVTRKMGNLVKPNLIVTDLGGGKYKMRSESTFKTTECSFKLGEKFKEVTPDSREVTSLITVENGVMKHEQDDKTKVTYIERVVEGNELKATVKVDEVVCVRTYSKVALKNFVCISKNCKCGGFLDCFRSGIEVCQSLGRIYLSRETNLARSLAILGANLSVVQKPLDEFDFTVTNLAVDLRDGLRLV
ncbi:Fatty acid-binding -like protein 1 [Echinococcus granulosus]|uniref:Fatty acid binding protein FABP2 n=3 Tax=Echinococcus granulosus TaxID=6210 RepID=A0A068WLT8_ECHGR|nr:Fatty acid-binding -like protein 1 [Echinococcus granulosus]CDS21088.1 fatty acid binding protein FABP2 [Echinococcus granulosus]